MARMEVKKLRSPSAFEILFTKNVPHIHEKIFLSLDYESIKSCREVSNAWNEMLTSESFLRTAIPLFKNEYLNELHCAAEKGNAEEIRILLSTEILDVNCTGIGPGRPLCIRLHLMGTLRWSRYFCVQEPRSTKLIVLERQH